jgi:hypothetical protein
MTLVRSWNALTSTSCYCERFRQTREIEDKLDIRSLSVLYYCCSDRAPVVPSDVTRRRGPHLPTFADKRTRSRISFQTLYLSTI